MYSQYYSKIHSAWPGLFNILRLLALFFLSVFFLFYLSVSLSACLSVCPCMSVSWLIHQSTCLCLLFLFLLVNSLSICLVCLSACLSTCLPLCLCVYQLLRLPVWDLTGKIRRKRSGEGFCGDTCRPRLSSAQVVHLATVKLMTVVESGVGCSRAVIRPDPTQTRADSVRTWSRPHHGSGFGPGPD